MAEAGNGNTAPVKQYTARLELPNNRIVIDLCGDDLGIVKENVQTLMKGGCTFTPFGTGTLIFHPTVDGGKKALGWLATMDIPAHMSNKAWIERRNLQAA
jgi:hypothetical protein